ncbi:18615_t:CDS:2 [Racocetra persica]|uniref:18615_t:CDS:1 n=1 Tax=Racocetra persica TaxID=160502 RepID=A0ACA9K9G7_9GLOM|nr:18615_t:CDS:2 [Racocetra persica]
MQSDINTQNQINHEDNMSKEDDMNMSNKDDMPFEDNQFLQPVQNEMKKYTDIQINRDPIPIMIYSDTPNILKEIFKKIFEIWIDFLNSLLVPIPSHFTVIDQDTGEETRKESSAIYHKDKPAIIKNEMVAARYLVILVQRLGWQEIFGLTHNYELVLKLIDEDNSKNAITLQNRILQKQNRTRDQMFEDGDLLNYFDKVKVV